MQRIDVPAGETIYTEGDHADAIYLIESGAVEVSRVVSGKAVRLAVFGRGEIFGESGILHDKPHSTTMRALISCSLMKVTKQQFFAIFGDNNPIGLPLLRMLSARLEKINERLLSGGRKKREPAFLARVGAIRILPLTEHLTRQIGEDGIALSELPFRVGRRAIRSDVPKMTKNTLSLHALNDHGLSPEHFEFEKRDGYLIIRDLGSHLGTLVNDAYLSRFGYEATAVLSMGANDVIAGPQGSPYHFRVVVEESVTG